MEHREPVNKQAACALSSGSKNKKLQTIEEAMLAIADMLTKPANIGIMRQVIESDNSYEIKIVGDPPRPNDKGHHGFRVSVRTRIFMDKPRLVDFSGLQ